MFFPTEYKKPVLQNIVGASANGWNATCTGGGTPASGGTVCTDGGTAGQTCLGGDSAGAGKGGFDGQLYTNPDNSSRLLNTDDVNSGL